MPRPAVARRSSRRSARGARRLAEDGTPPRRKRRHVVPQPRRLRAMSAGSAIRRVTALSELHEDRSEIPRAPRSRTRTESADRQAGEDRAETGRAQQVSPTAMCCRPCRSSAIDAEQTAGGALSRSAARWSGFSASSDRSSSLRPRLARAKGAQRAEIGTKPRLTARAGRSGSLPRRNSGASRVKLSAARLPAPEGAHWVPMA
jgi:hypothetical protein